MKMIIRDDYKGDDYKGDGYKKEVCYINNRIF